MSKLLIADVEILSVIGIVINCILWLIAVLIIGRKLILVIDNGK